MPNDEDKDNKDDDIYNEDKDTSANTSPEPDTGQPTEPTLTPQKQQELDDWYNSKHTQDQLKKVDEESDPEKKKSILLDMTSSIIWELQVPAEGGPIPTEAETYYYTDPNKVGTVAKNRPDLKPFLPQEPQAKNADANKPSPPQANQIVPNGQGIGKSLPTEQSSTNVQNSSSQNIGGVDPLPPVSETFGKGQGAPEPGGYKTGGDPVILFSGQFFHQVTDLEVKGRGLHFSFSRTYMNQTVYKGPLGYNWDHCYNLWLREEQKMQADGTFRNVVYRSNGQMREDPYRQILGEAIGDLPPLSDFTDALFQGPAGFFDKLEKSGGKYVMQTVSGLRFEYNDDLYIERIIDTNGNEMKFGYTDNLLTKITDPVGKEFILEYDEMNRITLLRENFGQSDYINRSISYNYGDNGDLEEVDLLLEPDLIAGTDYRYLGPNMPLQLQHSLTEIINPFGESILENEYGLNLDTLEFNRVVRQRSYNGEYRYEYDFGLQSDIDPSINPIDVPLTITRVYYPNDHSVDYYCNYQGNIISRIESVMLSNNIVEELVTVFRYNKDALLVGQTNPDSSGVEYYYERENYEILHNGQSSTATPEERLLFGRLVKRVILPRQGLGEIRRIVTKYDYHATLNKITFMYGPFYSDLFHNALSDQNVQEVYLDYYDNGNLRRIRYSGVELPDGSIQTLDSPEFIYDIYGSITDIFIGNLHTHFTYFSDVLRSGFIEEATEYADGIEIHKKYDVDLVGRTRQIIGTYGDVTNIQWTAFDSIRQIIFPPIVSGAIRATVENEYNLNRQLVKSQELVVNHDGTIHPDEKLISTIYYDTYGRIVKQAFGSEKSLDERVFKIIYTPTGLLECQIDSAENITYFKYNEQMLLSSVTRGWGTSDESTRKLYYDSSSNPVLIIDGRGYQWVTERDGFGRPHILRDPMGNESEMEYDAMSNVITSRTYGLDQKTNTKTRWKEIEFRYDSAGRCVEIIDHVFLPGISMSDTFLRTKIFHNSSSRIESILDASGNKITYTYDSRKRPRSYTDADGNSTEWRYDDDKHTVVITDIDTGTDGSANVVNEVFQRTIEFDFRNLPILEIDSLGNVLERHFDNRKLMGYLKDPAGHEYYTDYNVYGQAIAYRTKFSDHEIHTRQTYDNNGRIESFTTPVNGTTLWMYDSLNRISSINRNQNLTTCEYDEEDNITLQTDPNNIGIKSTYWPNGYLRTSEPDISAFTPPTEKPMYSPVPTSPSEFEYSPTGRVTVAKNGTASLEFHYDSLDNVIREESNNKSVSYSYNESGLLSGLTFPGGRDIIYNYSPSGLLTAISQNSAGSSYPGDPNLPASRTLVSIQHVGNRQLELLFGNDYIQNIAYDQGKRPIRRDLKHLSDGISLFEERILYGNRGEWKIHQIDNSSRMFEYDELNHLIKASDYKGVPLADITGLLPVNSEGNITAASHQSDVDSLVIAIKGSINGAVSDRSYNYQLDDNINRLSTEDVSSSPPAIDLTTEYIPDSDDKYQNIGGVSIIYDKAGNMIHDGTNDYRYDAYNKLTEIKANSGTVRMFYDPTFRVVHSEDPDGIDDFIYAGQTLIEWSRDGSLKGQTVPLEYPYQYAHLASDGSDSTPVFNVINSVIGWLGSDGNINFRRSYDPFGQVVEQGEESWPARFAFAGYTYDTKAGIYHLPARSYHPRFGRFLQRDPAGLLDGTNSYAYSHHAPGTMVDYLGLESTSSFNWGNVGRAVGTIATGALGIVIGAALISNPAGWVALGGAMLLSSGVFGVGAGLVQLGTSQMMTTSQSIEADNAIKTTAALSSSPGSAIGGTVAAVTGGNIEKGAIIGGLAEGAVTMGKGLAKGLRGPGPRIAEAKSIPPPTPNFVPKGSLFGAKGATELSNTFKPYSGGLGKIASKVGLKKPSITPTIKLEPWPELLDPRTTLAKVTAHEAKHASDALNLPHFTHLAKFSQVPGRGTAAFVYELRGYHAEFGFIKSLPLEAWRSMTSMEKAYLIGEWSTAAAAGVSYGAYKLSE